MEVMKKNLLNTMLVSAMMLGATSTWADDKTVVKYSFDDANSPALTAVSEVNFDYAGTSVVTSTHFLNVWSAKNGATGENDIPLSPNSEDISAKTWTLDYYWAAVGGVNKKAGYVRLMANSTTLFNIVDPANGSTMTLNYGSSTASITVAGMNNDKRFSENTKDVYNAKQYWYHVTIVGDPANGVKMTMKSCADEPVTVVEDVVLSETNVTPTSLIVKIGSASSHGIDELSLTYSAEGEVVQTPVAALTAVDGVNRTITATCETEGATLYHSTDVLNWTEGAEITVDESGNVYFKAVKGTTESDILTFYVEAGEAIVLNAPVIDRTSNTSVTITADQTNLLLKPNATIYYTYGEENGSFTGSKTLTVEADAVITAYAEATGYTTSETSERAVALFPTDVKQVENTATKTSGWTANAFSTETVTASGRTYAALLLDDVQWGENVFLQTDGAWGLRATGNWYINSATEESWLLMQNMKKGDIIVADVTYPASSTVNATYSKYSFGNQHAYEVTENGNVELALKKINASTMDYLYGIYSYTANSATGINNVTATAQSTVIFNMAGQRVGAPVKGINIINGKKVIK
jgi:hypothetical protein